MTYRGRISKAGTVVLEQPGTLPEGTLVEVRPVKAPAAAGKQGRGKSPAVMKFAGKVKGLPSDSSRNLDHYLYGHPKR